MIGSNCASFMMCSMICAMICLLWTRFGYRSFSMGRVKPGSLFSMSTMMASRSKKTCRCKPARVIKGRRFRVIRKHRPLRQRSFTRHDVAQRFYARHTKPRSVGQLPLVRAVRAFCLCLCVVAAVLFFAMPWFLTNKHRNVLMHSLNGNQGGVNWWWCWEMLDSSTRPPKAEYKKHCALLKCDAKLVARIDKAGKTSKGAQILLSAAKRYGLAWGSTALGASSPTQPTSKAAQRPP